MNQMKCSVSMTSLESPQINLRTPEGPQKKQWQGRQCCSTNSKKPRRTLGNKMWRRSWGSNNEDSGQEEFWRICQQSVQELVEANSDEQGLRHFLENYSSICEWLNSMQIERGRFVDAIRLSELADQMIGKHHWRVEVNTTAKNLSLKYPNLKEEFQWRLKHLNSQWDALEKILSRQRNTSVQPDCVSLPNNEVKDCDWVKNWLRQKESELQPLDFRTEWTQQLLEREILRYKSIQSEIEENASTIHVVLRQCQSREGQTSEAAASKENSKRSRLETRWLQLRLRVLEWVQHLSGVAERHRNLKKGRRSDIYYSASNWDSDGDSNEPLRKCPKFDDINCHLQFDERTVPTNDVLVTGSSNEGLELISSRDSERVGTLKRQCEDREQQNKLVKRSSTSEVQVEGNKSVFSNQGGLTEQVVPSAHSLVSQQEQVLLLNQEELQLNREEECFRLQGNFPTVTLDEVDCDMGQSHDSENVFSQSEHQFSNSVVEFTLDGSQCVGMKRKLSSPSASPPHTPSSEQYQQVVPRNISIYYFKHSDTEQEPKQQGSSACGNTNDTIRKGVRQLSAKSPPQARRLSRTYCEKTAIRQIHSEDRDLGKCSSCNISGGISSLSSSRRTNRYHHFCQKSRLFLEFDQEFEDDLSLKSYDEISFGSFDLDLDEDLEEGEVLEQASELLAGEQVAEAGQLNLSEEEHFSMMDLEGNVCIESTMSGSGASSTEQREANNSFNSCSNSNGNKSNSLSSAAASVNNSKQVVRLDEIEELVQKAELLVQQTTRSRGVDCDLPVQVGSSEDEDDETLMLPQKHCADQQNVHHYHHHHHHHHNHQDVMITPSSAALTSRCCGIGEIARGNANGNSQALLHSSPPSFHAFATSLRKCSVSSSVSSSSTAEPRQHNCGKIAVKSMKTVPSLSLSSRNTTSGGAVDSALSCNNSGVIMSTNVNNGSHKAISIVGTGNLCNSVGGGESGSLAAPSGDRVPNNSNVPVSSSTGNGAIGKTSKKSSRVRQWIRAHNSEIVVNQKNTSSCDASAESASDSEYSTSGSEHPVSSDDPTTVSTSTFLQQTHAALLETNAKNLSTCSSSNNISSTGNLAYLGAVATSLTPNSKSHRSGASSSETGNQTITPFSAGNSALGTVPLRSKKRLSYGKQRPKSFTDTLEAFPVVNKASVGSSSGWLRTSPSCFVSDSAINLLGNKSGSCSEASGSSSGGDCACSPGNSEESPSHPKKKGFRFKRRSQKGKRRQQHEDTLPPAPGVEDSEQNSSILRSPSITESAIGPTPVQSPVSDSVDQSSVTTSSPKPNFLISGPISHEPFARVNSENGSSMNTEELTGLNDQADWDSYQEKYLSEPYSEEPYDPDGTLKLLAFGEDYGQYLDRADSESSSMLSGFEPAESRKRRPLAAANRGEMADSDSDREELNYLLRQSNSQLRFIDMVFRGLLTKADNSGETPAKYAEMEATCDENISSLKLVLANVEESENLPFEIDIKAIQDVLEKWHILREKIRQAANIHHIKEEMGDLKMDFSNVQSLFCTCKQFDITDMDSLKEKIRSIEDVLNELPSRKIQLQKINDASLKTQVFLEDQDTVGIIKQQLNELYVLYEDNLQLGSFLLEKMRYLQDAWEQFEKEKHEFEKSVSVSNMRTKLRKEFSSAASTDSGHGTDFSHDSSISDSDMEFQERHKKLVALKERARKVKAFLPPGSPVFDILDQSVEEAEKGLCSLKQTSPSTEVIDLKSLYPKKKPFIYSRRSSGSKNAKKLLSPLPRKMGRKWTVVRRMVMFNMALMGMFLAAAYFLHPKCCEFTNTFCFSLVPHLTHESLPPI